MGLEARLWGVYEFLLLSLLGLLQLHGKPCSSAVASAIKIGLLH